MLGIEVGCFPNLVLIDQLRFFNNLPDCTEANPLLLDFLCRPAFRLAAHVVIGIHLGSCPLEQDFLELDGVHLISQDVPPVICCPAKFTDVIPVDAHILLELDFDAGQFTLSGSRLNPAFLLQFLFFGVVLFSF